MSERGDLDDHVTYTRVMDTLVDLASQVAGLPLHKLEATIMRAETLGPILHPAEFRDADLASQRTLVEAAMAFQRAVFPVLGWPPAPTSDPGP
jgi:hypothetical protein